VSGHAGRLGPQIALTMAAGLLCSSLAAEPLDVVRDCAQRISPAISGVKDIDAACPQLQDALRSLGLTPTLYDGWRERLNRDALKDLADLTQGYGGSKPEKSPDVAALPGILEALAREQTPLAISWWDAFKAWFAQHSGALTWLDRWLDRIGESTTLFHATAYSLVALVLAAALAVIVNEVRANGAGRRERIRAAARESDLAMGGEDSPVLEPAPLADKLMALLRDLVGRLMQTRRLDKERSLTHRELVARSAFDDESQRAVFAAVAGTAESIVYGQHGATPEMLNRVLSDGRALLARLSEPPSAH
jgi:hypothetical protein